MVAVAGDACGADPARLLLKEGVDGLAVVVGHLLSGFNGFAVVNCWELSGVQLL